LTAGLWTDSKVTVLVLEIHFSNTLPKGYKCYFGGHELWRSTDRTCFTVKLSKKFKIWKFAWEGITYNIIVSQTKLHLVPQIHVHNMCV